MGILKTGANFVGGTAEYGLKDGLKGAVTGALIAGALAAVVAGGGAALLLWGVGALWSGLGVTGGLIATGAVIAGLAGGVVGGWGGLLTGGTIGGVIGGVRGGFTKVGEQVEEKTQDMSQEIEKLRAENLQMAAAQGRATDAQSMASLARNVNQMDADSRAASFGGFNNPNAKGGHLDTLATVPPAKAAEAGMAKG